MPVVDIPADLVDQEPGGLSASVAGEAVVLSSKLTWDLLPTPEKNITYLPFKQRNSYNQCTLPFLPRCFVSEAFFGSWKD